MSDRPIYEEPCNLCRGSGKTTTSSFAMPRREIVRSCPNCNGAGFVTNVEGLRASVARLESALSEAREQRDAWIRSGVAKSEELTRAREEARAAREENEAARFWADEFGQAESLERVVFDLYAYVTHWHDAADALAGGPGKALPRFPPPSPEKLDADFAAARAAVSGRGDAA